MKFSLKTLLIAMCVVGATVGLMSRLLMENPELFMTITRIGSTFGVFVLAAATIIWIGLRDAERSRGLVVWGCTLILAPIIINLSISLLMPTGNPISVLTTQRLVATRLPNQIDEPWVWQELERRLTAGDLTNSDVDNAVTELTAYMTRTRPAGWDKPLSWQRSFLQPALQKKMVSDDKLLDLCDAFFGPSPKVEITPPSLTENDRAFNIRIDYGSTWADNSGLDVKLLWNVNAVALDDTPLETRDVHRYFGHESTMRALSDLTPGDHSLKVEFECVYVDAGRLVGVDVNKLTVDQWPKPLKRWTKTVEVPLRVEKSPR